MDLKYYEVLTVVVMKSSIFWDCPLKVTACFLLHAGFLLGFYLTLKVEATCSSEMLVDFKHYTALYPRRQNSLGLKEIG
jgi:hypothetical protein